MEKEIKKKLHLIQAENVIGALKKANTAEINKDNIVTIIEVKGLIYLIYQK